MNYCVTDFRRTPVRLQICSLQFALCSTAFFALFSGLAIVEDESGEKEIKQGLEKKLDKMVMRDLYGKFKTAPTEEERERARKEYLDRRGVPESFRW